MAKIIQDIIMFLMFCVTLYFVYKIIIKDIKQEKTEEKENDKADFNTQITYIEVNNSENIEEQ